MAVGSSPALILAHHDVKYTVVFDYELAVCMHYGLIAKPISWSLRYQLNRWGKITNRFSPKAYTQPSNTRPKKKWRCEKGHGNAEWPYGAGQGGTRASVTIGAMIDVRERWDFWQLLISEICQVFLVELWYKSDLVYLNSKRFFTTFFFLWPPAWIQLQVFSKSCPLFSHLMFGKKGYHLLVFLNELTFNWMCKNNLLQNERAVRRDEKKKKLKLMHKNFSSQKHSLKPHFTVFFSKIRKCIL